MVYCPVPGDYWLLTANAAEGKVIPAGTEVKFIAHLGGANATPKLWMVEYSDGGDWKPLFATQEKKEEMTGMYYSTEDVESRTNEVTYNWELDDKTADPCEGTFTTTQAAQTLKVRLMPVGQQGFAGKSINPEIVGASTLTSLGYYYSKSDEALNTSFEIITVGE